MDGKSEVLSASDLARAIERVRNAFTRQSLDGLESLAAQALVLIVDQPGLSVKQCAEKLNSGQPNASTAVARLVEEELILRTPSKGDPRVHSLKPTALGRARVQAFLAEVTK